MGNAISPCLHPNSNLDSSSKSKLSSTEHVKLIFWEGTTRVLPGQHRHHRPHVAGEIMVEHPDKIILHADSFFLGRPIPSLDMEDELLPGQTYFIVPVDFFSCSTLSSSSIASLCSKPSKQSPSSSLMMMGLGGDSNGPFEYVKGEDGRVLIKVVPEFIARLIVTRHDSKDIACTNVNVATGNCNFLCSTPELKRHYDQLVGSKEQAWFPKLETISESKTRFSPCRFIGLEWKKKAKE